MTFGAPSAEIRSRRLVATTEATRGDLSELEYISARQMDLRAARTLGLDAYIDRHRLDAVLFAGTAGAAIAAKAGYPSVQVPAGFVAGVRDKETPDYPYGGHLHRPPLERAHALASRLRLRAGDPGARPPPGLPGLDPVCAR